MVYIITSHLISYGSILDKEFSKIPKMHHTKEVMKYFGLFRSKFRASQDVSDEFQTSIFLIKYELQSFIEKVIFLERKN